MRRLRTISTSALLFALSACVANNARLKAPLTLAQVDVHLESGQADAALAILDERVRGEKPTTMSWQRLFSSEGYQHLKEHEASMGRAFTDSASTAFLMSDTLLQRSTSAGQPELSATVNAWLSWAEAYAATLNPLPAQLKQLTASIKPESND